MGGQFPPRKDIVMNNNCLLKWLAKQQKIKVTDQKKATSIIFASMVESRAIVFDKSVPYIWLDTYYQCILEDDIFMIIVNLVCEDDRIELNPKVPKNVYEKLRLDLRLQIDISGEFWNNQMFIHTSNGIYDIMKQVLLPDDNSRIFDYQLNFEYIPNCNINQTPAFKCYVESSLGLEALPSLLRITAYSLSSLAKGRTSFQLIGPGKRGKSLWLLFMEKMVDESLRTSIAFSELGKREYLIKLVGKRLNICADNDPAPMKNESIFKRITSGENVMARDLYQSAISFIPTAKLIFASNHELSFAHTDDELIDRLTILCFNKPVPENKRDPELLNKMLIEKNKIMSMAVDTLYDLVTSNYDFKLPYESQKYLQQKRDELHPDKNFLLNQTILDSNCEVSSLKLWESFKKWCNDNTIEPIGQKTFLKRVLKFSNDIQKCMIGPATKRINGFKGIRLKTTDDLESNLTPKEK